MVGHARSKPSILESPEHEWPLGQQEGPIQVTVRATPPIFQAGTYPSVGPRLEAMPDKVNASKVVCYIVRDGQLLVFRHADYDLEHVGLQVPAGSIRPEESPEDAALREAREETGLR